MTSSALFLATLAAAAITVSVPAFAQDASRTTELRYGDLNLASADGARTLKARVERAVRRVCEADGDRSLDSAMQARACTRVAIARAMPQVELALADAGTQLAQNSHVSVAAH